jgi:hypothetical protein
MSGLRTSPRSRTSTIASSIAASAAPTSFSRTGCTNGKKAVEADQAAIAAKLEELADLGGVGLTPHQTAVDRALEAVTAVNETIDKMGSTGELKAFNRAFKEARKVDPAIRYFDYIHAQKAAMLEALARRRRRSDDQRIGVPQPPQRSSRRQPRRQRQ